MTKIDFSFRMPEVIEGYAQGKIGKNDRIEAPGGYFLGGSVYDAGTNEEVLRMVIPAKPRERRKAMPVTIALVGKHALIRKDGSSLLGHSFLREYSVKKIPDTLGDHKINIDWFMEKFTHVMKSQLAIWSKFRTALAIHADISAYNKVYDLPELKGVTPLEAALITESRIFTMIDPGDLDRIVAAYKKLYGEDALGMFTE